MEKMNVKECINQGEVLSSLIDKLSVDNEFANALVNSSNLKNTMEQYGFNMNEGIVTTLENVVKNIKMEEHSSSLTLNEMLAEKILASVFTSVSESGNSAAGNWD